MDSGGGAQDTASRVAEAMFVRPGRPLSCRTGDGGIAVDGDEEAGNGRSGGVAEGIRALGTGEGAREGTAEVSYPGPIGGHSPHRHVTSSNAQCKGRSGEAGQGRTGGRAMPSEKNLHWQQKKVSVVSHVAWALGKSLNFQDLSFLWMETVYLTGWF